MDSENGPVLTLQMVETLVMALFAVIVAFRPGALTDGQQHAIWGLIAAAYVVIVALTEMARRKTVSLRTARTIKTAAYQLGRSGGSGAFFVSAGEDVEPTLAQVETYARQYGIEGSA